MDETTYQLQDTSQILNQRMQNVCNRLENDNFRLMQAIDILLDYLIRTEGNTKDGNADESLS